MPQRVYRENARLPVKVVEVNETSIGVVHMPMLYRVFGRGQHHDESMWCWCSVCDEEKSGGGEATGLPLLCV